MSILISGSLAYDYIMDFPDSFKNHILPDQVHILSVSFVVDQLRKEYGGCACNIAYTAKLLGGSPIVLGPLGLDGKEYRERFDQLDIKTSYMPLSKKFLTSSAHIITDKNDNQINAYHVGAGYEAADLSITSVQEHLDLAIIAPTSKDAMIKHAKECMEQNIPIVFDPGQQLTALTAQELMLMIGQAQFVIANDYELKLIQEKTTWHTDTILEHTNVLITTLGETGSIIRTKDEIFEIPPCPADSVEDPTGAGDAYRAGFFTAYVKGLDLPTCGRVGSVAATYAVEHYGTQNHQFTLAEFEKRYEETYSQMVTLS